jgi:hypothetical protein
MCVSTLRTSGGRCTDSAAIGEQILHVMSRPHGCSQAAEYIFAQGPSKQCLLLSERHGMREDSVGATAGADGFCDV